MSYFTTLSWVHKLLLINGWIYTVVIVALQKQLV